MADILQNFAAILYKENIRRHSYNNAETKMPNQSRYQRQIILDEIGPAGQEKISRASVLCIGAGGLGCPALLYLAAAGVGTIGIVDFDDIERSNLQRQTLYKDNDIGQNKAHTAQKHLSALNPDIKIKAYPEKLTQKNIENLFKSYDLIIDGTDNFTTKYLINDAAIKFKKTFIYGAIQGFKGQASIFGATGGPCYRCLYPAPPTAHIPSCAEHGVIGAVAGVIGTMQAMEAIKIMVDNKKLKPMVGELFCIDLSNMQTQKLSIPKNKNCRLCDQKPEDIILDNKQTKSPEIEQVVPIAHYEEDILIDVREEDEWQQGHIEQARHIPLSYLLHNAPPSDLSKDKDIILYCAKGVRSQRAAEILQAQGYSRVKNMVGGYSAWKRHCNN